MGETFFARDGERIVAVRGLEPFDRQFRTWEKLLGENLIVVTTAKRFSVSTRQFRVAAHYGNTAAALVRRWLKHNRIAKLRSKIDRDLTGTAGKNQASCWRHKFTGCFYLDCACIGRLIGPMQSEGSEAYIKTIRPFKSFSEQASSNLIEFKVARLGHLIRLARIRL